MVENKFDENNITNEECKIILSGDSRTTCLRSIRKRLVKSLYVYEESIENEDYDYKSYVNSVLWYVCSANELLNGEITSIVVNLNSIIKNDFDKKQFKKIILECKNFADYLLEG